MKTSQLELGLSQEANVPEVIRIKRKRPISIKVERRDDQMIGDLANHYAKREIKSMENKGANLTQDAKAEIYSRKFNYFNQKTIRGLKLAYVAAFNQWPLLPHEVY